MPRAGSTLLCNILLQNPRFHATATSGCIEVLYSIRKTWNTFIEHKAKPNEAALKRVLKASLEAYYGDIDRPVIFDKSRGWTAYIEMLEDIIGTKAKILVPVRPLPNILASFEKLHRENSKTKNSPGEDKEYFLMQSVQGRCEFWMRNGSPVGLAYTRIKDALARGLKDRLHFVSFSELTNTPEKKMNEIYDFLGEPRFTHNFEHVEQVTQEDDSVHGYANLHKIQNRVTPVKNDAVTVLGQELVDKYKGLRF
jgi:sulfotransferase